jgi:hypothetical protein
VLVILFQTNSLLRGCSVHSNRYLLKHNKLSWCEPVHTIDYRCEDDCCSVTASCVTISNPDLLSSNETGVNPGIRSWKKCLSEWARCQKAIGDIYFTKKWRAETLQPGLEFDNFKPRLKAVSSKASLGWMVRSLGGDDRGFPKEEVKTYLMAPMSPLYLPSFHLSSHL